MAELRLKSFRFRAERESDWLRLESLLRKAEGRSAAALSDQELLAVPVLYRASLSSLSVARATSLDRALIDYLESLCTRAYFFVYGTRSSALERIGAFFSHDWPAAAKAAWRETLVCAALTVLGAVAAYVHNQTAPGLGRIGVLVAVEGEGDQAKLSDLGRRIAMHVAATQPLSLSADDLDQAAIEHEKAIFTEQALESGKPANVVEKMVEGRIRKFLEEVVLLKQAFVMNPDQTVEQLVAETAKTLGSPVKVVGFARLALGEGVEKKPDDFAAEVAALTET